MPAHLGVAHHLLTSSTSFSKVASSDETFNMDSRCVDVVESERPEIRARDLGMATRLADLMMASRFYSRWGDCRAWVSRCGQSM